MKFLSFSQGEWRAILVVLVLSITAVCLVTWLIWFFSLIE